MRALVALLLILPAFAANLPDCQSAVLNSPIGKRLDSATLASTLSTLNQNGQLPDRFVTKRQARAAGWQPGKPLWSLAPLQGKSMGGDRFGNYERQLPNGNWREADLDYQGGKRNAKRLIYEPRRDGRRFVTIDHYQQFTEIPACR